MTITIDGIAIEITKKKMKTLRIRITQPEAKVLVSAPLRMSNKEIESFIFEKLDWIKKNTEQVKSSTAATQKSESLRMQQLKNDFINLLSSDDFSPVGIGKREIDAVLNGGLSADETAKIILKEKLSKLIPLWERRTGLYCSGWKIKKVKSYWGKCNVQTRELIFNSRLAECEDACIHYVVLHELAHIKFPNHGEEFKAFLSGYMPQWREIRKRLVF